MVYCSSNYETASSDYDFSSLIHRLFISTDTKSVRIQTSLNPIVSNAGISLKVLWHVSLAKMALEKAANQICFTRPLLRSILYLHLTTKRSSPLFRSSVTPLLQPERSSFSPRRDHRAVRYVSIRSIRLHAPILRPHTTPTTMDHTRVLFLSCSYRIATSLEE